MLFLIHTIHSIACLQRIIVYSNQTGLAGKSTIYRWFSHWNLHFWGFPSQPRLMTPEAILLWYPQAWPLDPIPFVLRCEKIIKILLFSLKKQCLITGGYAHYASFSKYCNYPAPWSVVGVPQYLPVVKGIFQLQYHLGKPTGKFLTT